MNQVEELGFDLYLQSEFAAPTTIYPTFNAAINPSVYNLQQPFFLNAAMGGDQLRRRVSFALNELWVVAGDKISDSTGYTNYLTTLDQDAFTNYFNLMKDITLTPAMGQLPRHGEQRQAGSRPARQRKLRPRNHAALLPWPESAQPDGSPVLDATGNPVPTYTQNDVMALGLAFTGWTYPVKPGRRSAETQSAILRRADGGGGFQPRHGNKNLAWPSNPGGPDIAPTISIPRSASFSIIRTSGRSSRAS